MVCTTPPWSPLTLPLSLQGAVTYQLPSAGVTWSTVFRQLEGNKERLGIVDYSVSQTTLDQVRCESDFKVDEMTVSKYFLIRFSSTLLRSKKTKNKHGVNKKKTLFSHTYSIQ